MTMHVLKAKVNIKDKPCWIWVDKIVSVEANDDVSGMTCITTIDGKSHHIIGTAEAVMDTITKLVTA